ncbi:1,4-alpha-glucan branching enzyme GlgB [Sediminihabitans luteus]|nr:1,4-alpha-glucan branching protein GlgB [Sediminihabitans luteus]GIJ00127.1 1,4-alpha-glucan branching enzyme GlgB [Sediminihabitans luteus]
MAPLPDDAPDLHPVPAAPEVLAAVAAGRHHDPHAVLGPHLDPDAGTATVRVLRPLADEVTVHAQDGDHPARHEQDGIWVTVLEAPADDLGVHAPDYRVSARYGDDVVHGDDPYRFLPTLGEVDEHLVREGRHEELWTVLGANPREYPSVLGRVHGTSFAVWAPNALAVRVIGDFNGWGGPSHAMRSLGSSGVWEIFAPGLGAGTRYKFEILTPDGSWVQKADPLAKGTEVPPATGSVVVASDFTWSDDAWLAARASTDPHAGPMSVYEVHLGSWRPGLTYRELAEQLTAYVVENGFTHVELMPVAEHPFGGSWGYQVTGYYAPSSRFGHPDDFRHLVDALHAAGVGVVLDWVPAHFPKDSWALARFDGLPLYEHPDPLRGEQPDWGTYVFDFGRPEVRNFLVANATYWLEEFHVDALRVDAVASMLYLDYSREPGQWHPNAQGGRENLEAIAFLQEANATAYRRTPGVMMIAEESTAWPGVTRPTNADGLGFGLKWNMGWMNDTLRYLAQSPVNRRYHHHQATFSLVYAYSEQFVLPLSHDEVVHGKGSLYGKMPGDAWQKRAGVRALLAYQWSHPGKQLLFMGGELAQPTEWDEVAGIDWGLLQDPAHAGVQRLVRDLNAVYRSTPALWELDFDPAGFEWLASDDADHNVLAYVRRDRAGTEVAVVVNFAGVPHEGYRLGLPARGRWREVLNSDAEVYGGSGVGNLGHVEAEAVPHAGRAFSARLRVPPLGVLYLVREPGDAALSSNTSAAL